MKKMNPVSRLHLLLGRSLALLARNFVFVLVFLFSFATYSCDKQLTTAKPASASEKTEPSAQKKSIFADFSIDLKSGSKQERDYEQRVEKEVESKVKNQLKEEEERLKKEQAALKYEKDQLNLVKLEKSTDDKAMESETAPIPEEARKLYQEGIESFRKNDVAEAEKSFKKIIAKYPNIVITQLSLLKLAELFFNQGNYVDSRFYSELLIDKYPNSLVLPEATYLLGKSYYFLKDYPKVLVHLNGIADKLREEENRIGAQYYYSNALAHSGDAVKALSNFHDLYTLAETSAEMRQKLEDVISETAKKLTFEELSTLQYRFPVGFTDAAVKGALITKHHKLLSPTELNVIVLRYLLDYPSGRDVLMVKVLRSQLEEGKEIQVVSRMEENKEIELKDEFVQKEELRKSETEKILSGQQLEPLQRKFAPGEVIKIGCILPLSGKYAEYAARIQQGIQLAEGSGKQIKVIFKDSGDEEKNLLDATRNLIEQQKVDAIIGPLLSKNAHAMARVAETAFIPVLTPTASDKGLVEKSAVLFSNALSAEEEGKSMAEYAMRKMGKGRFVIFKASDPYSMSSAEAFRNTVEKMGGSIVETVAIKPNQTDFTKEITTIGGIHKDMLAKAILAEKSLGKKTGSKEHSGKNDIWVTGSNGYLMTEARISPKDQEFIHSYDGIYIAAFEVQAASIASQLRFMNVKAQLLGNSRWRGKDFFKASGNYAKGALITDDFLANTGNYQTLQFEKDFHALFNKEPDKYAASGYAAFTILKTAYEVAVNEKIGLITALHRVNDYKTVTGDISFNEAGKIDKRLLFLEVSTDGFKQVK